MIFGRFSNSVKFKNLQNSLRNCIIGIHKKFVNEEMRCLLYLEIKTKQFDYNKTLLILLGIYTKISDSTPKED